MLAQKPGTNIEKLTNTVNHLAVILNNVNSNHRKKSIDNNRQMLKDLDKVYKASKILKKNERKNTKAELLTIISNVRMLILKKITAAAKAKRLAKKPLQYCWDQFLFANSLDYGSEWWDGSRISEITQESLFPIILKKLSSRLSRLKNDSPSKKECLDILKKIMEIYSHDSEEWLEACVLYRTYFE